MGIVGIIQILVKQAADGPGAVVTHIWCLMLYRTRCIHIIGTQLVAADTLPAWNSALVTFFLFTHIPTPATASVFTAVRNRRVYAVPISHLTVSMSADFLGNRIRRTTDQICNLLECTMFL